MVCMGCCIRLVYGMADESKNTVKVWSTLIFRLQNPLRVSRGSAARRLVRISRAANHLIPSDLQPCPKHANSGTGLLKYASSMRNERQR